jgi:hypothetical protein
VVSLPKGPSRYVRIRGRNFGVSEILGYDGRGRALDRRGWHATNFLGETPVPRRVLKAVDVPAEYAPGREYAIEVTAGPSSRGTAPQAIPTITTSGIRARRSSPA